jgi:hypothetical protein
MKNTFFYKRNRSGQEIRPTYGFDSNLSKNFLVTQALGKSGWIVSFELWLDPNNPNSYKADCKIWTQRKEIRVFKTLENVAKQLKLSGITTFSVTL